VNNEEKALFHTIMTLTSWLRPVIGEDGFYQLQQVFNDKLKELNDAAETSAEGLTVTSEDADRCRTALRAMLPEDK